MTEDPRFLRNVELAPAAFVRDEAEGEMIRGLLDSAGIPSILEGVGVLEGARFGLGGVSSFGISQKVLVHAHRLEEAREVIAAALDADDRHG